MLTNSNWIRPNESLEKRIPVFRKVFQAKQTVKKASLDITAMGVYYARLNGKRIGDMILAPGWTSYNERIQYQTYDITDLLVCNVDASCSDTNTLDVLVGTGWYRGRMGGWNEEMHKRELLPAGLTACLTIEYVDGTVDTLFTDETWQYSKSNIMESTIYDGEIYDASFDKYDFKTVTRFDEEPTHKIIPQQGQNIIENERIKPASLFKTPEGDVVLDFGQNITGYLEFTVEAKAGDKVVVSHAETLDAKGNFYTKNYRSAKAILDYTCKDGVQTYKPLLTFYGFRYVRLDSFPVPFEQLNANSFTAIVVHSEMRRTGFINTSNELLNKLFENIIWGQKGNFLDVPTDCPQRDERLGWTGDAEVFARTATYNFDVENFFRKWLIDLAIDQDDEGGVPSVVPNVLGWTLPGSAWGDASTIIPWQVYLTYGCKDILEAQFPSMKKWVDYLTKCAPDEKLMQELGRYGDWLALDANEGDYVGKTDQNFITTAYHVLSTSLVIKAGKVLGQDVSAYEKLYNELRGSIAEKFPEYWKELPTQTACALAIHFDLTDDKESIGNRLAELVRANGNKLNTGFVGTPYIMHALSETGHSDVAYSLLLQDAFPSWLYPVTKGATTMWEHWDGIKEDGSFWSDDMNSYNHYAYGAVADWIYGVAAGINPCEEAPGFAKILFAPTPDKRLHHINARIDTKHGPAISKWSFVDENTVRYNITTPSPATIIIAGETHEVTAGNYVFFSTSKE